MLRPFRSVFPTVDPSAFVDVSAQVIGDEVTIAHSAVVHGCTIENRCLIGMGAILLSEGRIGTGSMVGAGTLVPEGMQIPPGSMVLGVPARIFRQLTGEEDASPRWYADSYVRYRLDFQSASAAPPLQRDEHTSLA